MQNIPQSSNERPTRQAEIDDSLIDTSEEQMLMDQLIARGFVWDEALKLIDLRDHLYENIEMRQRVCDDPHMQFMRWLYEQGELTE